MEEVKQVARAKGELAKKYYQRAQKYYQRALEAEREVERVKVAGCEPLGGGKQVARAKGELAEGHLRRAQEAEREVARLAATRGVVNCGSTKGNIGSGGWRGKGRCGSKTSWCETEVERGGGCWSRGLSGSQQRIVAKARSLARARASLGGSGKQEKRRASCAETEGTSVCDKVSSGDSWDAISKDTLVFGSGIGDDNGNTNEDDDTGQHGTTREGGNKGEATGQELLEDQLGGELLGRYMQAHDRAGELLGKVEQRRGAANSGTSRDNVMKGSDSQAQDSGDCGGSGAELGDGGEVNNGGNGGELEERLRQEVEKAKAGGKRLREKVTGLKE